MDTRFVLSFVAAAFTLAATVTPAAAQTAAAPGNPLVVHAVAGLTFGGPSGGLFGAGAGANIAAVRGLTVFGEFGKLTSIMTSDVEDLVDRLAGPDDPQFEIEFDVTLPTTYGLAGARFDVVRDGPLNVFIEGGIGVGRVGLDVTRIVDGEDFGEDFRADLEEEGVTTSTEALLVIGGGVSYPITPNASITGGIRINRIAMGEGATKPAIYVGVYWRP